MKKSNDFTATTKTTPKRVFVKGLVGGLLGVTVIFVIFTNMILPLLTEKFRVVHPILKVVECSASFTDIYGIDISRNSNNQWELSANQDLLVWVDLPSNIDQLDADIVSSYPYEVKAGETAAVHFEVYCINNYTKYTAEVNFVAVDDLTLGSVCHGTNLRNRSIGISNGTERNFSWMEPGKHAYVHYPLYTSCAGEYNVYKIRGGRSSVGYDVDFEINAIGAPEMLFISDHPDGDPEKEFQAQRDADFQRTMKKLRQSDNQRQEIQKQIEELNAILDNLERENIEGGNN